MSSDDAELPAVNQQALNQQLDRLEQAIGPLIEAFVAADRAFYVVGGWVRDLLIATQPDLQKLGGEFDDPVLNDPVLNDPVLNDPVLNDIDVTTAARPDEIKQLLAGWAETVWTAGIAFGTVCGRNKSHVVEITTHRGEQYERTSRKPTVTFSDEIESDLSRRDFTMNALAIELPSRRFIDPFGGLRDLRLRVLKTPGEPVMLFSEDPLRILRAARFVATLSLEPDPAVVAAMRETCGRLAIVSAERISMELQKLLTLPQPGTGVELLEQTGVLAHLGILQDSPETGGQRQGGQRQGGQRHGRLRQGGHQQAKLAEAVDAISADPAPTSNKHDARWASLVYLGGLDAQAAGELLAKLRYSKAVRHNVESILLALKALQDASDVVSSAAVEVPVDVPVDAPPQRRVQARRLLADHHRWLAAAQVVDAAVASANGATKPTNKVNAANGAAEPSSTVSSTEISSTEISQDLLTEIQHIADTEGPPMLGKPLDGKAVLNIAQKNGHELVGAQVGAALNYLLECHFYEGPLSPERATELLAEKLPELAGA